MVGDVGVYEWWRYTSLFICCSIVGGFPAASVGKSCKTVKKELMHQLDMVSICVPTSPTLLAATATHTSSLPRPWTVIDQPTNHLQPWNPRSHGC